jgi:serine/threonine protein kinase
MRTPKALLWFIAKAILHAAGVAVIGDIADFLIDVGPDVVKDVWDWWSPARTPEARAAELAALAAAPDTAAAAVVAAVVNDLAADRPAAVRRALTDYLTQVHVTLRRTVRQRPAPGSLRPRSARDLLAVLPPRVARFRPGDRPLPNAPWMLEELLGVGGFGEVWKARDAHHPDGPRVALKFCLDPAARDLLRHEADLLHRARRCGRHPGLVALRYTHLDADPPCLEYEYVEGGTLAGLVREWQEPGLAPQRRCAEATRLVTELADVAAYLHGLRPPVVHRDLKPANVLVQRLTNGETRLRVTDLGIGGVAAGHALELTRRPSDPSRSLGSALRGAHTPLYASPQQMRGAPPDPRDDVFALGVVWHQLLTGDLTSGRPGGTRWLRRLAELGVSGPFAELLGACFEDDPADRPANGAALAAALRRAESAPVPIPTVPALPAPLVGGRRRLTGHDASVESLTFSPDGRLLLSGGADRTLRLWDAEHGYELRRLEGGSRWVQGVAFAPDGFRVAAGCWDRCVRVWHVEGWELARLEGHRDRVLTVAFTADGRRLLSAGADRTVRLWEVLTGKVLHSRTGHTDLAWSAAALSCDGRVVLSGSADRAVRLWDVETGELLRSFEGHTAPVLAVALSADGRRALSAGWDRVVRLWDVATGTALWLEGHTAWVWGVAFAADGRTVLSGGADGTVRLWDAETGEERLRFEGHARAVHSVAASPDGRSAASGGADGALRLWGLPAASGGDLTGRARTAAS